LSSYEGNWIEDLSQTVTEETQVVIVGNKGDLKDKRVVTYEEASDVARQYGFRYLECSAKSG
jgi:GTPase SAR1 family protein